MVKIFHAKSPDSPPPFHPITIILETPQEAAYLWHLLNNSWDVITKILSDSDGYPQTTKQALNYDNLHGFDFWKQLDNVFPIDEFEQYYQRQKEESKRDC